MCDFFDDVDMHVNTYVNLNLSAMGCHYQSTVQSFNVEQVPVIKLKLSYLS